jgi:hypothetical protein
MASQSGSVSGFPSRFVCSRLRVQMLRPKKFSPFETKALWGIAFLLIVAGISAALLALQQAQWRLGLASVGILVLAAVYIYAAIRGRPV